MTYLGKLLFVLLATQTQPGRSVYSFEPVDSCENQPKCELARECDESLYKPEWSTQQREHFAKHNPLCAAPRWSKSRSAWVRIERRSTALDRYRDITSNLASVTSQLVHCHNGDGVVSEDCQPVHWGGSATSLAISGLTVIIHESGGREDVQEGHAPLGLGPGGEVSLFQIMPQFAVEHALWLPQDERATLVKEPPSERIKWAHDNLLGTRNLARSTEIGLRMLARSRRACSGKGFDWLYAMFSMYGTGSKCSAGKVSYNRTSTYHKLWNSRKNRKFIEQTFNSLTEGSGNAKMANRN